MDTSEWHYLAAFDGNVAATLAALRAAEFDPDDYYWPHGGERSRPDTEDELLATGWIRDGAAHSILDVTEVGEGDPGGDDAIGRTFAVTEAECVQVFGTARVTTDDLERLGDRLPEVLGGLLTGYGVGRHLVVGTGRMLFFGHSGD
ncbi:hypothetical protein KZZ52_51660 [Dactylosporangium sp. AC04546]|uniref:hypothetical protein n=1 Tax=Dactylosporangium sp. AC04546 TaxID=2862460 RepID=UPI001EDD02C9|nr:hypothetical protein [Dactylosporangium sp. AC04546]WVK82319.1 hypothetical protein KZZ52_51660 [Dactylosporangium sp. AC04546]